MTILHKIQVYESIVGTFVITRATRNLSFKCLSLPRNLQFLV